MIRGNKPIGIGYPLLFINLADFENKWSLPYEVEIAGKENVENWVLTAQTAMWVLYEAADEVENISAKWQQSNEPQIVEGAKRTPSQSKKGAERLFLSFEKEPYLPKRCEKGQGRKKGTKLEKRKEYQVEKKEKTIKPKLRKSEQNE